MTSTCRHNRYETSFQENRLFNGQRIDLRNRLGFFLLLFLRGIFSSSSVGHFSFLTERSVRQRRVRSERGTCFWAVGKLVEVGRLNFLTNAVQ